MYVIEYANNCSDAFSPSPLSLSPYPPSLSYFSFVRVYGVQFSKQDHVTLVKLLFELVTIPDLESPLLQAWCVILSKLLKYAQQLSLLPDTTMLV